MNTRPHFILLAAIMVMAGASVVLADQQKASHPQTTCPVMGGKIDKDIYIDHDGKRIYFCCADCPDQFEKYPEKYLKSIKEAGVVLEDAPKRQTTCPVMGGKINSDIYVDRDGKRIYFCCNGCPATFSKEPEKYLKVLADEGVTLQATPKPQTICPVMGGKINKDIYGDHDGKRVYFCCNGCPEKFKASPEEYIKKLEDEGITLDKAPAEQAEHTQDSGAAKGHGEHAQDSGAGKSHGGCGGCGSGH